MADLGCRNAPGNAKADLKKELVKCGVRKAIATYIISGLGIPGGADVEKPAEEESLAVPKTASGTTASASASVASSNFIASLPGSDLETLEPDYVNTYKELEEIFQAMSPPFEGRESEGNWLAREKNCTKVRKLLRGNAYKEFQQTFLAGVKALLGGFLKAVNSLRTTLSTNGCQLVKDLAIICGPGLDPFVDILLTNTIKVCANTKKITAQMGNVTTSIILANVSYHPKILQHIWGACQDKNVQPRTFATGWLSLMLDTHIESKGYLEHTGGLEVLEKCMKRGLADANPGVREGMRKTFWKFASIWPDRGDVLISGLDASSKKLLEKVNPNAAAPAAKGPSSIRNPTLTRTATAPMARSSVKDAIMAQKRQLKLQRTETLPPEATVVPPAPPSGLSSAPVRPQRPKIKAPPPEPAPLQRAQTSMQLSVSANRAVSPSTSHSSTKETPHFSRRSPAPSSPPQTLRVVGRTPMRQQVPQVAARKLSLLDQLNHQDWRIRVEGIVIVACILAKKTPPNYDRSSKMPSLPPSDALAATLQRLLNDPQPEVVEHVVAPEVLSELVKVVPMEQIVTKVLLLSEGDDEDHSQPIMQSSMPALKGLMTQGETTDCLFRILTSMGAFGTVPKRLASTGSYTTTQKKKIIHGCLIWLAELIELALEGNENMYLEDRANYKTHASRLIQMCSSTKPPNYMPLATALKKFRKLDQLAFDKILATFEMSLVRDLRRAWGQPVEEEGFVEEEEKVAHVQEVLGMVPVLQKISPTPMSPRSRKRDFSPSENVRDQMRSMSASRDQMRSMSASLPPVPVTPPRRVMSMASEDKENKADAIPKLPELPVSRDGAASPASAKNGSAKVYQDAAVVDSNGAVATTTEKQPQQENGEWYRTKMRKQLSNSNLPKSPENTARLLQTLVKRLKARDIDTQALRKLMAIARENPVREVLKENNTEGGGPGVDIWAGGRMFDELLTTLLGFLDDEEVCTPTRVCFSVGWS